MGPAAFLEVLPMHLIPDKEAYVYPLLEVYIEGSFGTYHPNLLFVF
jgi:hypothetical protein